MSLFSGKAGFVTGAAGGIGRASAIAFARDGASVIAADGATCDENAVTGRTSSSHLECAE